MACEFNPQRSKPNLSFIFLKLLVDKRVPNKYVVSYIPRSAR